MTQIRYSPYATGSTGKEQEPPSQWPTNSREPTVSETASPVMRHVVTTRAQKAVAHRLTSTGTVLLAGTASGYTFGIVQEATIHPVRATGCGGSGTPQMCS